MNAAKTISLASYLRVDERTLKGKGVLNTILGIDTKLFVDPKLLEKTNVPELTGSHEDLRKYFDKLLRINAQASKSDRLKQESLKMIAINEPVGLSIGYGNSRDSGTAISESVAKKSLVSLNEMLSVGIEDLTVMELLGLFIKGFGPDSISDLISHILYDRLCRYTERVSQELGLKTTKFKYDKEKYKLPAHPFKNHHVVFLPLQVLRPLPLATSWEEIASAAMKNASIRKKFNELVGSELKKFIANIKKNPSLLTKSKENINMLLQVYKGAEVNAYDTKIDELSYDRLAEHLTIISKIKPPVANCKDTVEMSKFIKDKILFQLKRDIEQLGANRLLYHRRGESVDPNKPVHEEALQILLHVTADQLCRSSNIMVTRESKTGVGSVDFAIGSGYTNKVIVEAKKSSNNDLIKGYERQLTAYLIAEAASSSFYVVTIVRQSDSKNPNSQLNKLIKIHTGEVQKKISCPQLFIINGLIKPSASNL